MDQSRRTVSLDVALIGMAGRFPGAASVPRLWENLCRGAEGIRLLADEELAAAGVPQNLRDDPNYVKARGVLDGIEEFDAAFFGYTPREAELMVPQQRLFLECSHEALEAAGYAPDAIRGRVGVFGGMSGSGYLPPSRHSHPAVFAAQSSLQETIGREKDFLTTQVSYRLNFRGPSLDVQTACSSSLVAVHLGCLSLLTRECDLALAGGASIAVPQQVGYLFRPGGILSSDGHCRPFDARATGTVPGSGVAVVVLKRLEEALADGDWIRAVIKGSAINNDGRQKVGFAAPSVDGQAEVIADALAAAGIDGETVGYVEAHGTGTALGDPVEVAALRQAFATTRKGYCALGALKASIGHLDAAAGVAGLIKAVMCLEHRLLLPSPHFEAPNAEIDFGGSPFYVNSKLREWKHGETPRRAGVSAFGIGGTNAHVVLEEAPPRAAPAASGSWQVLVLSTRTDTALETATANLAEHLRTHSDLSLADVSYTLQVGRSPLVFRRFAVCRDVPDAVRALESPAPGRLLSGRAQASPPPVAFVFPGQASAPLLMGLELYHDQPRFREEVDRCIERSESLGFHLREAIHPSGHDDAGAIEQVQSAPLALFVLEYALARFWMELAVRPSALLGRGVGEYVAACLAGIFSLEDALALVAERARLLAGRPAFPSGVTEDVREAFAARVHATPRAPPEIPCVSAVTGTWITAEQSLDASYWASHLQQTVRSTGGLEALRGLPRCILLEVGPAESPPELPATGADGDTLVLSSLRPSAEHPSEVEAVLGTLGRLWTQGLAVDWTALHSAGRRQRLSMPTYPFERERYWVEPANEEAPARGTAGAMARARDVADWFYMPGWRRAIPAEHLDRQPEADLPRSWLVFEGTDGLGADIAQGLRRRGCRVAEVLAGRRFAKEGEDGFILDRENPEHFKALLREVNARELPALGIVHAWTAGAEDPSTGTGLSPEGLERGFHSLLFLAQALGEVGAAGPVQIEVVTSGLFRVTGLESIRPERSLLLGPCEVIPLEYPNLDCRVYDLDASEGSAVDGALLESLIAEFFSAPLDRRVAYRSGQRWLPTCSPVPLRPAARRPSLVRKGGTYLITGGLRQPGLAMARSLAEQGAGALVFQVDEPPSPPDTDDLRQIRELGPEVLVAAADLSDPELVEELLTRSEHRFGRIHGVIHCPQVPSPALMRYKTAPAATRALAPLAFATRLLRRSLERRAPDFMFLSGSSASLRGFAGGVAECALAAFLAAFADSEARPAGIPMKVLAWPPSAYPAPPATDAPAGVPDETTILEEESRSGLGPGEVSEAFERLLCTSLSEIVVSPYDFSALVGRQGTRGGGSPPGPLVGDGRAKAEHGRPKALGEYLPPKGEAETRIAALWERLFGIRPIGRLDSFLDLGGNSLLAIQMIAELREALAVELPLSNVFESPTVAGLASAVSRLAPQGEQMERLLREVEALSPEDAQALLARELEEPDGR